MQSENYTQVQIFCAVIFIAMVANFLTAFFSLTIGLYFQYAVRTAPATSIAIAMYTLAGIIFVVGELIYFAKLRIAIRLKRQTK